MEVCAFPADPWKESRSRNEKKAGDESCEQRAGMDRNRDLLFRQVEFQGMGSGTAAFIIAGAVTGAFCDGTSVLLTAGMFGVMPGLAFAAAIPVGGGHGRGARGAMAYDREVGCEDDQQR